MIIKLFKPRKITKQQARLYQTLEFLVRLLALSIPLYAILLFVDLILLQNLVAQEMMWLFKVLGWPVTGEGLLFTTTNTGFVFMIAEDCTAWKSMIFFFALIFAVPGKFFKKKAFGMKKPSTLKRRLIGLGIGIPVIWVGNLARILGIVWVEQTFGAETAMIVHAYLWQLGLIVLVLLLWFVWLLMSKKNSNYKLR